MGSNVKFDCRKFVIIILIIFTSYFLYFFRVTHFSITEDTSNYTKFNTTFFTSRLLDVSNVDISNNEINYHRMKKIGDKIQMQMKESAIENNIINKRYFSRSRNIPYINCKSLFENKTLDNTLYHRYINETPVFTAQNYIESTRNCSSFIINRGYITHPLTTEEEMFPVAFSILIYTNVEQAERLLRAIYRPQNYYCIHVDSKTDDVIYDAMRNISNCLQNVFVLKKRIKVIWGNMSVLEPELLCMQELLTRSKRWKYFINLTGQEFPLRTNYEIVKILQAYNGSNDVETTIKE